MRWKHSQKLWPDRSFQLLWIRLLVKLKLVSGYYMMFNCDQKVLGLHRIKKPPNSTWHVWLLSSLISSHRGIMPTSSGITSRDHLQLHFSEVALHSLQPPRQGHDRRHKAFPLIQPAQMCDVVTCYVFCVIFNINILFVKIALFKSIFFLLKMINEAKMRFETTAIYN